MDTYKIIFFISVLLLSSCSEDNREKMVSQEKYNEKIREYVNLNKRQAAIIEDNIEKSEIINNVVSELRQLTGMTISLKKNIDEGVGSYSQASEIQYRLNVLKDKLKNLSSDVSINGSNAHLVSTIKNLQSIISQQDSEIKTLQKNIANQKETIAKQQYTINSQQEDIIRQQRELLAKQKELIKNQQDSWYMLGRELYNMAQSLPSVRGKKDKNNINNSKIYILSKSRECFNQAKKLGHRDADNMIRTVSRQISYL